MSAGQALIAVIPARGGSKRVPGKNIRTLGGKPAIQHTIDAALESKLFDTVIVSTDDQKTTEIAIAAGAEVPFVRDATLSDDFTPVSTVTIDALERVDSQGRYKAVCQLMPNCPLRNAEDIRVSYEHFTRDRSIPQISVTAFGWLNPLWAVRMDEQSRIEHLMPDLVEKRSQDLPRVFCPTGAVWWADCKVLKESGTFHVPGKRGWEIPWQRAIDIDSEEDWQMAETLLLMQSRR